MCIRDSLIAGLIYFIAKRYRDKYYPTGHPYHVYFLPSLSIKMVSAIVICLIYVYYYKGGDTINYFNHAQIINSAFSESPEKWLNLLLAIPPRLDPDYYEYTRQMEWYGVSGVYLVAQLAAIFSLFTFNTFLPASLLFAALSFTGIWALFLSFANMFPKYRESIATSILFIPSVALWGSGIFKDTLCLFGLGWLCYATLQFFVNGNRTFRNTILMMLSFLLVAILKVYIVICFIPALFGWMVFKNTSRIPNKSLAAFANLIILALMAGSFVLLYNQFSGSLGKYSVENIRETAQTTRGWIAYMSKIDKGSGYDLGNFDPTFLGMLSKFPQAVNVALFRPYFWEANKLIAFFNAIESLIFLLLSVRVLLVIGWKDVLKTIANDHTVQFTFIFSIIFAYSVGITTYNFGALSRYRIPCLPFYLLTLVLIFYQNARPGQRLFKSLRL